MGPVKDLANWKQGILNNWPQIRVELIDSGGLSSIQVGDKFTVRAQIFLGSLNPNDILVELYIGQVDSKGEIIEASAYPMQPLEAVGDKSYIFESVNCSSSRSGIHGYTVRVLPNHPDLVTRFLPGLITWA